jgi:hypothetical protein
MDSVILFNLETDKLADNFPVRSGLPVLGFSPIADDLNNDGTDEIIVASDFLLSVFTSEGDDFLEMVAPCASCEPYLDTMSTSINRPNSLQPQKGYPVPVYYEAPVSITANPVTGDFGDTAGATYVAVGYPRDASLIDGDVVLLAHADGNQDGQADVVSGIRTKGFPIALSFGEVLYAVSIDTASDSAYIYRQYSPTIPPVSPSFALGDGAYFGTCQIGSRLAVLSGDDPESVAVPTTYLHVFTDTVSTYQLGSYYTLGPITVDVNADGTPEVVMFTPEGNGLYLSVDTMGARPSFSVLESRSTGYPMTVNPTAGDVDLDGRVDIIIAGPNAVYAFNSALILKTDFPFMVDDRHIGIDVITPVVVSDIERGGLPELIYSNNVGNVYAHGERLAYGFPVNSGEQLRPYSSGAMVVFSDSTGGKMGYLGGDGWFYAWEVDEDSAASFWPMNGASPVGDYTFRQDLLGQPQASAESLPKNRFYNYPNPVLDGRTAIRYFLGEGASRVTLNIFDLSGERIATLDGPTEGMIDNEVLWDCDNVTPGVYRCVIDVEFAGRQETAFTDIAVIK